MHTLGRIFLGFICGSIGGWCYFSLQRPDYTELPGGQHGLSSSISKLIHQKLDSEHSQEAILMWLNQTSSSAKDRAPSLRALLSVLPLESYPELMAALVSKIESDSEYLLQIALHTWTMQAPEISTPWIFSLETSEGLTASDRSEMSQKALRIWSTMDFQKAYDWTIHLPESMEKNALLDGILADLAKTDLLQALSLSKELSSQGASLNSQYRLFNEWLEQDPKGILSAVSQGLVSDSVVNKALARWLPQNPREAMQWMTRQLDRQSLLSTAQTLYGSVNMTPDQHREFFDQLYASFASENQVNQIDWMLRSWGEKEPKSIQDWINQRFDGIERIEMIERVTGGRNTPDSLPLIMELPADDPRSDRIHSIIIEWAKRDPEAALQWYSENSDSAPDDTRNTIESVLLGSLAANDPSAAIARWQQIPDGIHKTTTAGDIAMAWIPQNLTAASDWLAQQIPSDFAPVTNKKQSMFSISLPELLADSAVKGGTLSMSGARSLSLENAIAQSAVVMTKEDPQAALNWAESLSNDYASDIAFASLKKAASSILTSTETADLYCNIQDPVIRSERLNNVLSTWLKKDYESARQWMISKDNFPDENVITLLEASDPTKISP